MNSNYIRIFDLILSGFLIFFFFPFMIFILFFVFLFIDNTIFFLNKRVGRYGKKYIHIKFKSLLPGEKAGRIFFEQNRINYFGKIIRKYHFDELPELFLIFSGKQSFIGPRPLPSRLLFGLDTRIRESVRPGITCLAQIYLLRHGFLNKNLQISLDNKYVKRKSFIYNNKIILATIKHALSGKKVDLNPELNSDRQKYKQNLG